MTTTRDIVAWAVPICFALLIFSPVFYLGGKIAYNEWRWRQRRREWAEIRRPRL